MNEFPIEESLKALKDQTESGLMADWGFSEQMRSRVFEAVNGGGAVAAVQKVGPSFKQWGLAAVGFATCLLIFAAYSLLPADNINIQTVAENEVNMDGALPLELVKTVKVNMSKPEGSNFATVIWASNENGNGWTMVYSEPHQTGVTPLPIQTIDIPDQSEQLLLVSTRTVDGKSLNYKVLGFDGTKVNTYLERNGIPGGKVSVGDGYVSETGDLQRSVFKWNGQDFEEEAALE